MGMAEPGARPPGAASPSAKSIQEDEIPLAVMVGRMKKFSENTSTIPEVMDSSSLNFNQILSFHDFLDPTSVCASKPWLISSVYKNSRAQHHLRAEI